MPSGTPYHQLARPTSRRRTLLAVLGVLLSTVTVPMSVTAAMRWLPTDGLPLLGPARVELLVSVAAIGCILPAVLVIARFVQGRPIGTLSSVTGRIRWGWLALCVGVAAVTALCLLVVVPIAVAVLTRGPATDSSQQTVAGPSLQDVIRYLVTLALLLCLGVWQVAAEEYTTRGFLLQAVTRLAGRSPWPGIIAQAIVFTALHRHLGWGTLAVAVMAGWLGWLTVRTGGIEAALAYHLVQNGFAALVAAAMPTGPDANAAGAGLPGALAMVGAVTAYALLIRWLAPLCRLARTAPGGTAPGGPPPAPVPVAPLGTAGPGLG
ncbi:CPBP family intramembrane glutamic endopeptidase [Micromonospora aurantiaca (nom. illeg.)]|uniref:CPBP family intramembrane glutamic endopeptidase n=2 Tax=Micromonospora aurantiaca (nom. illeg.) TaxID=47850 RepID=UPI0033D4E6EB